MTSASTPLSVSTFYEKEDRIASNLTNHNIENDLTSITSLIRAQIEKFSNDPKAWKDSKFCDGLLVKILMLRRLNRFSNFRNRALRERFLSTCGKVEAHFLQLQNLKSEIGHLKKAIDACLEFQSSDVDIELSPLEDFKSQILSSDNKTDKLLTDPHLLHLARLTHELKERKSILSNLQELQDRKSLLLSDINGKEQRLLQVKPKIDTLKQNAKPLLDILGLKNVDASAFEQQKKFKYLPKELELTNLSANVYNKFFDEALEISCEGDIKKAIRYSADIIAEKNNATQQSCETLSDEEMELDDKEDEFDDDAPKKKNRKNHRKSLNEKQNKNLNDESVSSLIIDKLKAKRDSLLSFHPIMLSVKIPIPITSQPGVQLCLLFIYLNELKCVGLKCNFLNANISNWHFLDNEFILDDLYDGDFGQTCPNRIGNALLSALDIKITNYFLLIGKPYNFVQKLCGLSITESKAPKIEWSNEELGNNQSDFKVSEVDKKTTSEERQLSELQLFELFANVVQRIKDRVTTRFNLSENLAQFEQLQFDYLQLLPTSLKSQVPTKVFSKITELAPITSDEIMFFNGLSATQKSLLNRLKAKGLFTEAGFHYKAIVERASFSLSALIYLPASYPRYAPIFLLVITSSNHRQSTECTLGVVELEQFLNTAAENLFYQCDTDLDDKNKELFVFQLALLCSRLDVVLELTAHCIATNIPNEKEFVVEHNYVVASRKCGQNYPFWFDNSTNSFCFELPEKKKITV